MKRNLLLCGGLVLASLLAVTSTVSAATPSSFTQSIKNNPMSKIAHDIMDKVKGDKGKHKNKPQEQAKSDPVNAVQACQNNTYTVNKADFPYWNTNDTFPCMYAGTFNTSLSNTENHNLFFWMIKNIQLDTTTVSPNLIIWVNGGPGSTSMQGLFLENGPLHVTGGISADKDDFVVSLKSGTWGDIADVLYLDNPVNTGFSYGDSYVTSIEDAAREFVSFFDQFMRAFPEYQVGNNRNIYLTGESFGGKYLTAFAKLVDDKLNTNDIKWNIKGIILGNPLISPPIQRTLTHQVAQALGVVDANNLEQIQTLHKNCEEALSSDWSNANTKCEQVLDYVQDVGGDLWSYDARIFTNDYKPVASVYEDFLASSKQSTQLYKALHIDGSTKSPIFTHKSTKVANAFNEIAMLDSTNWVDMIIDIGYDFLIYLGEWDQRDGPTTVYHWLRQSRHLARSPTLLWDQPKQLYYVPSGSDFIVGGYWRRDPTTKVTVLTMPKAGHFAPMNQLATTVSILQDYFTNNTLVCHKTNPQDCQITPIMCNAMNNCTKHGTCQANGQCLCDEGFKSADCSEKAVLLTSGYSSSFHTNGTQWLYFYYKNGLVRNIYHEFTLSSQFPLDIYIISGWQSDPNEFNYELAFKKQSYMKISSKQFPSLDNFVVAVKVNGIEHYSSIYHVNTLNARFDIKTDSSILAPPKEDESTSTHQLLESQNSKDLEINLESTSNDLKQHHKNDGEDVEDWRSKMYHDSWDQQDKDYKNKLAWLKQTFEKVKAKILSINFNLPQFVILTVIIMLLCVYRIALKGPQQVKKNEEKTPKNGEKDKKQSLIDSHEQNDL